jgi:hypothetical protein
VVGALKTLGGQHRKGISETGMPALPDHTNQVRIWAVSLPFQATAPDQATASAPGRLHTQHHPDNAASDDLSNAAIKVPSTQLTSGHLQVRRGPRSSNGIKSYGPVSVSMW